MEHYCAELGGGENKREILVEAQTSARFGLVLEVAYATPPFSLCQDRVTEYEPLGAFILFILEKRV